MPTIEMFKRPTPGYSSGFPAAARRLGGEWDRTLRVWWFPTEVQAEVDALMLAHYGTTMPRRKRNLSPTARGAYSELAQAVRAQQRAERKQARTELLSRRDALMAELDEINAKLASL